MADHPAPRSPHVDRLMAEALSGGCTAGDPAAETAELIRRLEAADVEGALALLWARKR